MIKLRIDSRDAHFFQKFGSVSEFPAEANFDGAIQDAVQSPGNVECTCYSVCDIASDQDQIIYDTDDLFNRIPHTKDGANPRDALNECVKRGLKRKDTGELNDHWSSYWVAHTGMYDAFDNVRSALLLAESPIAVWSQWYREWGNKTILPKGQTATGGHMYVVEGWKNMSGMEPMLIVEAWLGYKVYMPREVFNDLMEKWGNSSAVLSTNLIDSKRKKTLLEKLIDACKNLYLLLVQKQAFLKEEPMTTPKGPQLYDTAMSLKGQYLSLDKTVPKQFNCCQCVSYIFKQVGLPIDVMGISGTGVMNVWLKKNGTEISEKEATVGDVLIFVTEGDNHGHVFILGKVAMLSNDSDTGTLQSYWNLQGALGFYRDQKHLQGYFYRL